MSATATVSAADSGYITIGGLLRFFDDDRGEWIEVKLHVDLAEAIASLDRAFRQREKRQRKREPPFSDVMAGATRRRGEADLTVSIEDRLTTEDRVVGGMRAGTSAWQGPRITFQHLLGLNLIWPGPGLPGAPCLACGGRELAQSQYCVYCDRCGAAVVTATPAELRVMRDPVPRRDGLAGGVGPKPPARQATASARTRRPTVVERVAEALRPKPPAEPSGPFAELDRLRAERKANRAAAR
jgi:hypothetical protein